MPSKGDQRDLSLVPRPSGVALLAQDTEKRLREVVDNMNGRFRHLGIATTHLLNLVYNLFWIVLAVFTLALIACVIAIIAFTRLDTFDMHMTDEERLEYDATHAIAFMLDCWAGGCDYQLGSVEDLAMIDDEKALACLQQCRTLSRELYPYLYDALNAHKEEI